MTGFFELLLSVSVLEKVRVNWREGSQWLMTMSKHTVDTALILRRCRGAYRAKSDFYAEANLATIAIKIKVQFRRMVGPGGGIACVV